MSGVSGGSGGGISGSSSSSAASGDSSTGDSSVNVGGFNPPALASLGGNTQMIVIAGIVIVAVFWLKTKKR